MNSNNHAKPNAKPPYPQSQPLRFGRRAAPLFRVLRTTNDSGLRAVHKFSALGAGLLTSPKPPTADVSSAPSATVVS